MFEFLYKLCLDLYFEGFVHDFDGKFAMMSLFVPCSSTPAPVLGSSAAAAAKFNFFFSPGTFSELSLLTVGGVRRLCMAGQGRVLRGPGGSLM